MSNTATATTIYMGDIFTTLPDVAIIDSDKLSRKSASSDPARAHLLAHCRALEELYANMEKQEELLKVGKVELKRQIGRVRKQLEG